ncbi:MAG TPA: MerR family transcriptional regulator [Terracidiphilus sp.]|nr:MerR family transcriptional regulator [Terracidiphilus sp.]
MSKLYRIHQFAQAAGVTGKALRHYERLGLLKPRRTDAGYRLYADADLDRIERITALKFLGLPLKQIKAVLDRPGVALPEALRLQRGVLEQRQRALARAIRAIEEAEEAFSSGQAAEAAAWKRIIEAITVQNDVEFMKKYYSDEAWLKRQQYYEHWPPAEFEDLFREIGAALGEDPAGQRAQALKTRWREVLNPRVTGDPAVQAGALAAWNDREHWPEPMRHKVRDLKLEEIVDFLARVMSANWKKLITAEEWIKLPESRRHPTEPWNQWVLRAQMALEEDPPGENARALVLRVMEL